MAREFEIQGLSKREYNTIHKWVRNRIKKMQCSHCGTTGVRLENALIKGRKYEKNIENYIPLCNRCHSKYDDALVGIKRSVESKARMSVSKTGTTLSEETKKKMSLAKLGKSKHMKGRFGELSNYKKAVINTESKEIFPTVQLAAKSINYNPCYLSRLLNGRKLNTTKLKFYDISIAD